MQTGTQSLLLFRTWREDGKESTTLTDEVYQLIKTDAENQRVIYTVINNNDLTLKYIYKNKKPVTVTTDYDYESSVVVIDDSLYYVNSKSELIYRKINGSSLGKEKVISKEVQGSLNEYANGVYFYKKVCKHFVAPRRIAVSLFLTIYIF